MNRVLILLMMLASGWPMVAMADSVAVHALMIEASNNPAPIDRRLEHVEYKLRRVFGFSHYRFVGEGRVIAPQAGQVAISLPDGHKLDLQTSGSRRGRVTAEVRWVRGRDALLSTRVQLAKGSPVVLGGVPHGEGTLIVVLTAE
jgi:hypothetical protein